MPGRLLSCVWPFSSRLHALWESGAVRPLPVARTVAFDEPSVLEAIASLADWRAKGKIVVDIKDGAALA